MFFACCACFLLGMMAALTLELLTAAVGEKNKNSEYYKDGFEDGYKKAQEEKKNESNVEI